MEMKSWTIGFVLLAVATLAINSEHVNDESDRGFLGQRKFSSNPPRESEEFLGVGNAADNEDQEVDMEFDDEEDDANQKPAGVLIRDADLEGSAGILVIQNGPPSSLPLMFELRPVMADSEGPYIEVGDDEVPQEFNESDDMIVSNDRFKPTSAADSNWEDDEGDDDYQEMAPPKRRIRPTMKLKRRQSAQLSNVDRDPTRPSKKTKRPVSQPIQKKRKRNPNRPQNQNKNKKNKNKNTIRNQKRKPNNQRKRLPNRPKRRKNSGNRDVVAHQMNHNVDRKKHLGVKVKKGSASNELTHTVTTTQTGSADDEPSVNYIVINRPTVAPTTERPFWDILGRSAGSDEADRGFNLRKPFNRRSLG